MKSNGQIDFPAILPLPRASPPSTSARTPLTAQAHTTRTAYPLPLPHRPPPSPSPPPLGRRRWCDGAPPRLQIDVPAPPPTLGPSPPSPPDRRRRGGGSPPRLQIDAPAAPSAHSPSPPTASCALVPPPTRSGTHRRSHPRCPHLPMSLLQAGTIQPPISLFPTISDSLQGITMDCAEWIINEQEIMCFASSNFSALRRPFHRREADRISLLRRRGRRKSTADPLW